ncbi:MAG TPA: DUF362 domain-containing protein [Terriglobia bacterium]|nr:DUF362 domain-containing protein [Terriglobia bacterium]
MGAKTDLPGRRHALLKLARLGGLGGLGAATAGLGVWLSARSKQPEENPEESLAASFEPRRNLPPDPNLPELVVVQGEDPRLLVRRSLEGLGGIGRFVVQGDVVLIKPNIAWDRTPEQAANTNPQVVAEMVRLCREAGARKVIVTDVSCNDPRRCFRRSGIAEAASAEGAEVVLPEDRHFKRVNLPGNLGSWPVLEPLLTADKVINIPVAKHHSLTGVTLGMKNWIGIVGGPRVWLHQDIHTSVVDLAEFARPTVTIIDAYRVLVRNGPTGGSLSDVEVRKTLIAGTDPVALDAYAAKTYWNLDPRSLRYLKIASDRGLGNMNFEQVRSQKVTL